MEKIVMLQVFDLMIGIILAIVLMSGALLWLSVALSRPGNLRTRLYLRYAGRINWALRKVGLLLMAEFQGDPPYEPLMVARVWLQRDTLVSVGKLHAVSHVTYPQSCEDDGSNCQWPDCDCK